ncbi:MAG: 4-hydroxy-tetrahydrodipicolinate synthase [Acidobacteria bacterium]|nr:4-hydroxy-tetrahydrodipicolinate synthase [Acidobacteriota bacterium]
MFTGCGTALVTPFRQDGAFDEAVFRVLIERQIEEGINFLVPCGTTGENPTLSRAEQRRAVEIAVNQARGKVPVLAGAGGYNTHEVIEQAREWRSLGVDGILSVAPYYNKPTQEGLFQHYRAIADAVRVPIIVYNVPGRTGVNLEPATIKRLAQLPHIAGVKEASGNINQIGTILNQAADDFLVLSGDDAITLPTIALGGRGVISVASNEIPRQMTELAQAALHGDFERARRVHHRYLPLMEVNFIESSPLPVKYAMSLMGLLEPVWRLPMVPPAEASKQRIEAVLEQLGLLAERSVQAD